MDNNSYSFKNLESKYDGFLAHEFTVTLGSKKIDSARTPISELSVDIETGRSAGGCRFVIESQYDYKNSVWINDLLSVAEVGARIVIEAGYVAKKEVFYGFTDDFSIEYEQDSPPRLIVNGIDAKGYLMNAKDNKYMSEEAAKDIISEILNECVSKGYAKSITLGEIPSYNAQLIQEKIDDYEFMCLLAEMYNMQFFVVDGEIIFDSLMSDTKPILTLTLGVNLLSFSKTLTLRKQVGKVIIYGIDPKTKKPISGEASSVGASGASGKQASELSSSYKDVVEKEVNLFVSTPEECTKLAQARFDARAFDFICGRGRCIGIPELIPGRYIMLEGMDKRSSDIYFITKVSHSFSSDQGYYTSFEVKGAKSK